MDKAQKANPNYQFETVSQEFPGCSKVEKVVTVKAEAIVSKHTPKGTPADSDIEPAGWGDGACPFHHQRGHLIGNQLGGRGDVPENLVTLTGGTNHPIMYEIENAVFRYLGKNEGDFKYTVECAYDGYTKPTDIAIPVPGAAGNPFCLFPAPARLYVSLSHGNDKVNIRDLLRDNYKEEEDPKWPKYVDEYEVDSDGRLVILNGVYKGVKLYAETHDPNCWAANPNWTKEIEDVAKKYATKLGYFSKLK